MLRFSIHYFVMFSLLAAVYPYLQVFLRARGFSEAEVGLLQGVLALAGVLGPMVVGYAADRLGRRRAPLIGCLVVFALLVPPLNATSALGAALALVVGIGMTVRTPIPLTDTLAAAELPDPMHQYGRVRVWGSVGFVLTLFGIKVLDLVDESSSSSMARCMLVGAALCMLSSLLLPEHRGARVSWDKARSAAPRIPRVYGLFLLVAAMHQLGMASYYAFFTIYLHDTQGLQEAAWVWALGTAAETPLLFCAGWVIQRLGLRRMLLASMACVSVRLLVYALTPVLPLVLAAQLFHAGTFGLFHAASIESIRRMVPAERRSLAMTLYMSLAVALPGLVGGAAGGMVVERLGYATLYGLYAVPPLLGMALLWGRRNAFDAAAGDGPVEELVAASTDKD